MSFDCPTCGAKAAVILTRAQDKAVRRRHQCSAAPTHKFSTVQFLVKDYQRVPPREIPPETEET